MTVAASVIVPTCNRAADLRHCLDALSEQSLSPEQFEVLVIDDGSIDDTAKVVEAFRGNARLDVRYHFQPNRGPAAARNRGIGQARGELIAFTDDDCRPDPEWLTDLLAALPADPLCAGVGGKTIRLRESMTGRYIDAIGMMRPRIKHGQVLWLVTANALYRRSCLEKIGGFDEQFAGPGGEDVDLSAQLRGLGYYFTTTERALVRHNHRDTLRGLFATFVRYGQGEKQQVKLGRKCGLCHRLLAAYLVCCLGHFAIEGFRLAIGPGFQLRDRMGFPWLRLLSNAGIFVGYALQGRSG